MRASGGEVTGEGEDVVGGGMEGEEPLRRPGRLEPLQEFTDEQVSMSDNNAWRAPLPVELQNAVLSKGAELEQVPENYGVKFGMYER